METIEIKGLAIAVLFVLAFIGGAIPLFCIRADAASTGHGVGQGRVTIKRIVSLLNSTAAGIFLSIALVHLLPDVRIIFETSLNVTHGDGGGMGAAMMPFDWAGFTAACGFLLVVFFEQMMMWCMEQTMVATDDPSNYETIPVKSSGGGVSESSGDYGSMHDADATQRDGRRASQSRSDVSESSSQISTTLVRTVDDFQHVSSFRALILLVSLSLHSVFEGLALGLQFESRDTIDLFVAISVHKAIESFTVLLRFAQIPGRPILKWTSLIIFSLASPIGIGIGIPLSDPSVNADALLINGVLQGLATGTFMFVTFVELLPVELSSKDDRLLKYTCMLAGFGLMCGLTQV